MRLQHIHELASADEQAVIVNVGTKLVTTLALMSALRYAKMPVLVIDCESRDGSVEHFSELMREYQFDLLSAPLKRHGLMLDWLFTHIPTQKVLLIDSDLEILGSEYIDLMRTYLTPENVFGSGFVHNGTWMTAQEMFFGYYVERMWIPLTMLKVRFIHEAIQAGASFVPRTTFNDFPPSTFISRMLLKRFRIPFLKHWRISWLDLFRKDYFGIKPKPSFVQYDTGAELYQYLKRDRQREFIGLPLRMSERYVTHFHGVTRLLLNKRDAHGTKLESIADQVARRLDEHYGITVAA